MVVWEKIVKIGYISSEGKIGDKRSKEKREKRGYW